MCVCVCVCVCVLYFVMYYLCDMWQCCFGRRGVLHVKCGSSIVLQNVVFRCRTLYQHCVVLQGLEEDLPCTVRILCELETAARTSSDDELLDTSSLHHGKGEMEESREEGKRGGVE